MRQSPQWLITAVRHPSRISIFFYSCVLCKGFAQMICETLIVMYYPENSMKSRITNGSQPHYHNQSRGAQESQTGAETCQNRTKTHSVGDYFNSQVLTIAVCLFNKITYWEKWLLWERFWQWEQKSFAMYSALAGTTTNKALKIWSFQIANQAD